MCESESWKQPFLGGIQHAERAEGRNSKSVTRPHLVAAAQCKWSKAESGDKAAKVKSHKAKIDEGGRNKWVPNHWAIFPKCQ